MSHEHSFPSLIPRNVNEYRMQENQYDFQASSRNREELNRFRMNKESEWANFQMGSYPQSSIRQTPTFNQPGPQPFSSPASENKRKVIEGLEYFIQTPKVDSLFSNK
jgi:hypothetical protein